LSNLFQLISSKDQNVQIPGVSMRADFLCNFEVSTLLLNVFVVW